MTTHPDLLATKKLPVCTMRELVYGPAPRRPRYRLPTRAIFLAAFLGTSIGCATASRPVEVEAVGTLTASYHSVAVAPLKHDAPPELGQVIETGDAEDEAMAAAPIEAAELPEVATKNAHGF
jgi:hypothetical protein